MLEIVWDPIDLIFIEKEPHSQPEWGEREMEGQVQQTGTDAPLPLWPG